MKLMVFSLQRYSFFMESIQETASQPLGEDEVALKFRTDSAISDGFLLKLLIVVAILLAILAIAIKKSPRKFLTMLKREEVESDIKIIESRQISKATLMSLVEVEGERYLITESSSLKHTVLSLSSRNNVVQNDGDRGIEGSEIE